MSVKMGTTEEQIDSVIKGAKVFANLANFQSLMITGTEWNETGPEIVKTKCP